MANIDAILNKVSLGMIYDFLSYFILGGRVLKNQFWEYTSV
ncbi:hypothetical protein [Staphylococcus petrasii]|nr:hypothetical protein [Staphylococcus petrasii]